MKPLYDINKIKFGTDPGTWERAVGLYEAKKVRSVKDIGFGWEATVQGTKLYRVWVDARHYDKGHCTCYLGETDVLCKHMVAVAIYAVANGKPLGDKVKQVIQTPTASGRRGELSKVELATFKAAVSSALECVRGYDGPSSTWFRYTYRLAEGASRLTNLVSELPVSPQTAALVVDVLLRLEKKLSNSGVDDSDGAVGSFMTGAVDMLIAYAELDTACYASFSKLRGLDTSFGWEKPLLNH